MMKSTMTPELQGLTLPSHWSRILIDGDPGAGKTTLAKEMKELFEATVISFDSYLPGKPGKYLEGIDVQRLKKDIRAARSKVIIEGVFGLQILERIEIGFDYHVFIKLKNASFGWELGNYLEKEEFPRSELHREVVEYYRSYRPFDVCNFCLGRDL